MRHTDRLALVLGAINFAEARSKEAALGAIGRFGVGMAERAGGALLKGIGGAAKGLESGAGHIATMTGKAPGAVGASVPWLNRGLMSAGKGLEAGADKLWGNGANNVVSQWGRDKVLNAAGGLQNLATSSNAAGSVGRWMGGQILNPFSGTTMMGINPMQHIHGLGHAYGSLGPLGAMGRLQGKQEVGQQIAQRAATQLPSMLENVPFQTRLMYLLNPGMFKGQITPEMLTSMMSGMAH